MLSFPILLLNTTDCILLADLCETGFLLHRNHRIMSQMSDVRTDAPEADPDRHELPMQLPVRILLRDLSLSEEEIEQVTSHINLLPAWKCLIFILGGMIAIKYGGDFVVDGASAIAVRLGLSQTLIGLTIIAMGTSLPELVTSIVAARKDEVDMALGNVIGSNIFNILLVLGVAAAISPVAFAWDNMIDIAVLIVISVITLIFAWTSKELNRKEGIIMLILYAAYMVYICIR